MPDMEIALSAAEIAVLVEIRDTYGLPSIEEAATWLLKARVREQMERVSGRRRAIYEVKQGSAS